jgi:two-component system NtrC family response regulator
MSETPARPKLLVVEDDEGLQRQLRWSYEDYEVVIAGDRATAINLLRQHSPDVATLDLGLPPDPDGTSEGFATLNELLALKPEMKVIVASGHGARESALKAIELGAYDFYQKPVIIEELGLIVRRAFHLAEIEAENRRLRNRTPPQALDGLITAAPEMLSVVRMIERVADTSVSVMLLGASGTGKEVLARGLHARSSRRDAPFVAINCAAIPETLLEAELFGYEKGAFTGAVKTTEGKIELANGGTLFLDEIGDVPLPLQVKLLRFIQQREIERLGGRKAIPIDTRIITATHRDIDAMVKAETFREDLYFRLAEIIVRIPALAERIGDAALLAQHFIQRYSTELKRPVRSLSADAVAALADYHWPGNVRELENRVKRAVLLSEGRRITAVDLGLADGSGDQLNLKAIREAADRRAIRVALARADGNVTTAARLLGISRPTFYSLVHQYGIETAER